MYRLPTGGEKQAAIVVSTVSGFFYLVFGNTQSYKFLPINFFEIDMKFF